MSSTIGNTPSGPSYPQNDATTQAPGGGHEAAAPKLTPAQQANLDAAKAWDQHEQRTKRDEEFRDNLIGAAGQSFAEGYGADDDTSKSAMHGIKKGAHAAGVPLSDKNLHAVHVAVKDDPGTKQLVGKLADPGDADTQKLTSSLENGQKAELGFMQKAFAQSPAANLTELSVISSETGSGTAGAGGQVAKGTPDVAPPAPPSGAGSPAAQGGVAFPGTQVAKGTPDAGPSAPQGGTSGPGAPQASPASSGAGSAATAGASLNGGAAAQGGAGATAASGAGNSAAQGSAASQGAGTSTTQGGVASHGTGTSAPQGGAASATSTGATSAGKTSAGAPAPAVTSKATTHMPGGAWNTYVAMAMFNATKELQLQKKDELSQIKMYNGMLDSLNKYTKTLMDAQQDLQTRTAALSDKDRGKGKADSMTTPVYNRISDLDVNGCDQDPTTGAVILRERNGAAPPANEKVTQQQLTSMIQQVDQWRGSINNNQQLHSSNFQSLDTQVTSFLNMVTALFKNVNDTQSGLVRNLPT